MKIVVLDSACLNPGDLDWSKLKSLGVVDIYEHTASKPDAILQHCSQDTNAIITNKVLLGETVFEKLTQLKLIAVAATGVNSVNLEAAKRRNISVCNVPSYSTPSVAQHTFALILELMNHVGLHNQSVQNGDWARGWKWSYFKKPLIELAGKTIGIVGFGNIGKQVAKLADAFEMKILVNKRSDGGQPLFDCKFVEKEELFAKSDIVTLHCPLTSENEAFIDANVLNKMKPNAVLINTARGGLINEHDLCHALKNNIIGGAGLDVLSTEPPDKNNPLLGLENCIITPHSAWASFESRQRCLNIIVENISAFMNDRPQNLV